MLKTEQAAVLSSGGSRRPAVQLPIDPARVLDRQVISGEVAAGLVVAPGRNLHIGLPFRRAQHAGQKSVRPSLHWRFCAVSAPYVLFLRSNPGQALLRAVDSALIPEFLQQLHTRFRVRFRLDAIGRKTIDDAQDSPPLFRFRHDYFNGICCCTINVRHFGNRPDAAEDIDRKTVSQRHHESMSGRQSRRVLNGILFEFLIVSVKPNQAIAGCFVECNPELKMRRSVDHSLVDIFNGFDEMALPDNDVPVFGNR